jgi:hypothetical protein
MEIPLSTDVSNSFVKKEARLWQSDSNLCSKRMKILIQKNLNKRK